LTALSGAAMSLRTMADGTVRVTIDFEPKDRKAVMEMLGSPGQPCAVVALEHGHAAAGNKAPAATYRDFGPICREAIDLCGNGQFQEYAVRSYRGSVPPSEKVAKQFILTQCNVDSRKDLDTAEGARDLFIEHVRKPFHAWLAKQAVPPTSGAGY
jgi:hypothetical protein